MNPLNYLRRVAVTIFAMACLAFWANAQSTWSQEYVPGEVIVKFKGESGVVMKANAKGRFTTSGKKSLDTRLSELGIETSEQLMPLTGALPSMQKAPSRKLASGRVIEKVDLSKLYCLSFDKVRSVEEMVEHLSALPEVEYAEPNYIVRALASSEEYMSDPLTTQQWSLKECNLPQLWDMPMVDNRRPVIAILDTGVEITHPDLKENIWTNEFEANGAMFADDDNNGYSDDLHGWDFIAKTAVIESGNDNNGHGTHCAGIAAARGNNGIGIVGANPDAYIMVVRVLDDMGQGDIATTIKGIDYALASGADILSMSFGREGYPSMTEERALLNASFDAVCCAAAGNDGKDINGGTVDEPTLFSPAAIETVIGVMASNPEHQRAGFSNYDSDGAFFSKYPSFYNYDVMVPGQGILSTFLGGTYSIKNGTSMACPFIAGTISRILQVGGYQKIRDYGFHGDLSMSRKDGTEVFDALRVLEFDETTRGAELVFSQLIIDDKEFGNGDSRLDAGEIVDIYPVLKSLWGPVNADLTISCELDVNMLPGCCEFIENNVDFGWHLNTRGSATSKNPIRLKIGDKVNNLYNLKLRFFAKSELGHNTNIDASFDISNIVRIGGLIDEDMVLYPDKSYLIDNRIDVIDGAFFKVMPGTTLLFDETNPASRSEIRASNGGRIELIGAKDSLITIKVLYAGSGFRNSHGIKPDDDRSSLKMEYVNFELENSRGSFEVNNGQLHQRKHIIVDLSGTDKGSNISGLYINYINIHNYQGIPGGLFHNYVPDWLLKYDTFNNGDVKNINYGNFIALNFQNTQLKYKSERPSYFGSNREDIIRGHIFDSLHPTQPTIGIGKYDLSNRFSRPISAAHGIVWKVLVDDIEVGDDFENLPPLGVGKHKVEVYFSKPMDRLYTPEISMGLERPFTQTVIGEDGSWRSEEMPTQRFINLAELSTDDDNVHINYWGDSEYEIVAPHESNGGTGLPGTGTIQASFDNLNAYIEMGEECDAFEMGGRPIWKRLVLRPNEEFIIERARWEETGSYVDNWSSSDETVANVSRTSDGKVKITTKNVGASDICWTYQNGSSESPELLHTINLVVETNPEPQIILPCSKIDAGTGHLTYLSSLVYYGNSVDVYTAYITLDGKENIDGVNRIRVSSARDNDGFEIPQECYRFDVMVQASGSFSSGFMAETGPGKVLLNWEEDNLELDDFLGYNMYRYTTHKDETGKVLSSDTIRINRQLITEKTYVDYDVEPNTTYYYYYKKMRTDFSEHAASKVVAATPRSVGKGDANASGNVDVADVVTEVNYMVGRDPKPFIFDAADVNDDAEVDILDVVGTVNIIMAPAGQSYDVAVQSVATYTVEDGVLYVDSPVELAGMQAELSGNRATTTISVLQALRGMENTGEWVSDEAYRFLAFSLSGRTLGAGRHALLEIGSANIDELILVDAAGNRIMAIKGTHSGISSVVLQQMKTPTPNPFVDVIDVPVLIGTDGDHAVELSLVDLSGAKVFSHNTTLGFGEHKVRINAGSLQSGFYLLTLTVDGAAVQTHKVIKK